jgi:GMP synthase-like glutamine amidotransferase
MKILIIDNTIDRDCWGSADLARFAAVEGGASVTVRRGPQADLPVFPERFDRLVLSGSKTSCLETFPWVEKLEEFTARWIDSGKPFLGVCYGHQILARALGGRDHVRRGKRPEFGWTRIEQVASSRLLEGLPKSFVSYSSHYEEVGTLPSGFRLLARSSDCAIQAAELVGRPVFGIQFHPERDLKAGDEALRRRKKEGKTDGLLGYGKGETLFDPAVGATLFRNFFST